MYIYIYVYIYMYMYIHLQYLFRTPVQNLLVQSFLLLATGAGDHLLHDLLQKSFTHLLFDLEACPRDCIT